MKMILVITDFSIAARNATVYAAELSKISGAKIRLLHVCEPAVSTNEESSPVLIKTKRTGNKNLLEAESAFISNLYGITVDYITTAATGLNEIKAIDKKEKPDLIILGVKDPGSKDNYAYDTVIADLLGETEVPIIIIPERTAFRKIANLAFAIDFDLETELEMHDSIKELTRLFNPKIFVLNIVKSNAKIRPEKKVSEDNIERYFKNLKHTYYFIQDNDLIHGLNEFNAENKIDLLTMLPHKHSLLEEMYVESKTEKMTFNTNTPLLIFPMG